MARKLDGGRGARLAALRRGPETFGDQPRVAPGTNTAVPAGLKYTRVLAELRLRHARAASEPDPARRVRMTKGLSRSARPLAQSVCRTRAL